jgi:TRAP transporter TAXI family solute receptor
LLLAGAVALWSTGADAQNAVRFGTSSVGSTFYTMAVGAGEVITKHSGINVTVEPLGGSSANVFGIGANKIDFAIANSYAAYTGYNGIAPFKEKVDLRLLLQGEPTTRYLIVRKDAGIKTPKDLEGKTIIAKRRALPELEIVMNAMIKAFGLDASKINMVATTNTGEASEALRAGTAHGVMMPFALDGSAQVEEPMRDGIADFLYLTKDQRDQVLKLLPPTFYAATAEKNTFSNQAKDAHVFSLNTYVVARPQVADETVYKVAKALFDNTKELSTYHGTAGSWTKERAVQNPALPFHPGVIKYFKEKGLWSADLEAKNKEMM